MTHPMIDWLLLFVHMSTIATTQPMPLDDCLKWQCRMKPEQKAVCIRVIETPLGPFVERESRKPIDCGKLEKEQGERN